MWNFNNKNKKLIAAIEVNDFNAFVIADPSISDLGKTIKYGEFNKVNLLHIACLREAIEIIDFILNKEIGLLHSMDEDGRTPLHFGIRVNSYAVVKLLIEKGADVDFQNTEMPNTLFTPLQFAIHPNRSDDILKLVFESSNAIRSRQQATENTNNEEHTNEFSSETIRYLFLASEDQNASDKEKEDNLLKRLQVLKQYDFDFNVVDSSYTPVLFYAIEMKFEQVIKQILEYGADPNLKDLQGGASCDYATAASYFEIVPLLFQNGGEFATEEMKEQYFNVTNEPGETFKYKIIANDLNNDQMAFIEKLFLDYTWSGGLDVVKYEINKDGADLTIEFESKKFAAELDGYGYINNRNSMALNNDNDNLIDVINPITGGKNIMLRLLGKSQFFGQLWSEDIGLENKQLYFFDANNQKFRVELSKYSDLLPES